MWNKDQVKGKVEQATGAAKEKIGRAVGDEDMEADGVIDQVKGNAREGFGDLKKQVKREVADVAEDFKKPQHH